MNYRIKEWIGSPDKVEKSYKHYLNKKIIQKIPESQNLIDAHMEKSQHNIEFSFFLITNNKYLDWVLVGLYYSLYHASLALLAKKGFSSKDHTATICFLIKHYSIFSTEELEFYESLALTKTEIEFYTGLKKERQKASYSTEKMFDINNIRFMRKKTITIINKMKSILD
ncbi:MAG: DNA-binding protein [archaeon]|nr:DNA-binding protein [archaeon]